MPALPAQQKGQLLKGQRKTWSQRLAKLRCKCRGCGFMMPFFKTVWGFFRKYVSPKPFCFFIGVILLIVFCCVTINNNPLIGRAIGLVMLMGVCLVFAL